MSHLNKAGFEADDLSPKYCLTLSVIFHRNTVSELIRMRVRK